MKSPSLNRRHHSGCTARSRWKMWIGGAGLGLVVSAMPVAAAEPSVPWECSEYSGEAQTRCMNTLLELQQEKIAKLEEQLKAQEGTVNELKEKMDRQEAEARREAKKAYKQDPRWPPPPYVPAYEPSYSPAYGYAPIPPIGIYLGNPWRYPRYYGYGPGYWGRPGLSFNFRFGGGGYRHRHR
ncbi:MAG: hypothetical protein AB7P17_15205 [Nitrospirales bacterium]|nr:hypothetical protein [Nitrospirales bacterium]